MSKTDCQINTFNKVEIHKIAKLLESVWSKKENPITSDRWINWLENLNLDFPPFSITTTVNDSLAGWILLVKHSQTELEINPWALGGHPITLAEFDTSFELSNLLLKEAISLTKNEGFRKLEILYHEDKKTSGIFHELYSSNNFTHLDSTNHMRKAIPVVDGKNDLVTSKFDFSKVSNTNQNDLLDCFLKVFNDTNDPWMKEKTKEELKDYFYKDLLGGPFKIIDEASITVSKEGKIIGFSIVKQSHGEGNGNIWIIGVHPDFRRKKIGTGIFSHITNSLKQLDYKTMSLNVSSFNIPAYQLYLKLGFEISWTQLNYVWKN